jgi:hypothetical protein
MIFCFISYDFANGFDIFLDVCQHIASGHGSPIYIMLFMTSWLLTLEKQTNDIQPITIKKITYWLVACTFPIQLKYTFANCFNPH